MFYLEIENYTFTVALLFRKIPGGDTKFNKKAFLDIYFFFWTVIILNYIIENGVNWLLDQTILNSNTLAICPEMSTIGPGG